MDRKTFIELMLKLLGKEFPDQEFSMSDQGFFVRFRPRDSKQKWLQAGLDNVYRRSTQKGEGWEKAALAHFKQVFAAMSSVKLPPINQVHDQLLPLLEHRETLVDGREFVHQNVGNDLVVSLVLDTGKFLRYLTERDIRAWGRTPAALWRVALTNLVTRSKSPAPGGLGFKRRDLEEGTAVLADFRDGFDATRILLPGLYKIISQVLGEGDILVGTPSREVLVAFRAESRGINDKVMPLIRKWYHEAPYPLTEELFLLTPQGVTEYRHPILMRPGTRPEVVLDDWITLWVPESWQVEELPEQRPGQGPVVRCIKTDQPHGSLRISLVVREPEKRKKKAHFNAAEALEDMAQKIRGASFERIGHQGLLTYDEETREAGSVVRVRTLQVGQGRAMVVGSYSCKASLWKQDAVENERNQAMGIMRTLEFRMPTD